MNIRNWAIYTDHLRHVISSSLLLVHLRYCFFSPLYPLFPFHVILVFSLISLSYTLCSSLILLFLRLYVSMLIYSFVPSFPPSFLARFLPSFFMSVSYPSFLLIHLGYNFFSPSKPFFSFLIIFVFSLMSLPYTSRFSLILYYTSFVPISACKFIPPPPPSLPPFLPASFLPSFFISECYLCLPHHTAQHYIVLSLYFFTLPRFTSYFPTPSPPSFLPSSLAYLTSSFLALHRNIRLHYLLYSVLCSNMLFSFPSYSFLLLPSSSLFQSLLPSPFHLPVPLHAAPFRNTFNFLDSNAKTNNLCLSRRKEEARI